MRIFPILVVATFVVSALGATQAATDDGWRAKLSPSLADAMAQGQLSPYMEDGKFHVMITGWPHPDPVIVPTSREAWNDYWETISAPFLGQIETYARQYDVEVVGVWPSAPSIELVLTPQQIEYVAKHPLVQGVSLDYFGAIRLLDTFDGGPSLLAGESIPQTGAETFWNRGYRGEGILLAIVDTGIFANHAMLRDATAGCGNRVVKWKDIIANQPNPYDDNGHGTHVAGTAAGTTACGGQLNGVAPNARLMGVKILSGGGSGSWAGAQQGLQWAFDNGADITSNSWGGGDSADSRSVAQTAENLAKAGMDSVFAAGNSGPGSSTMIWPGSADLVVTIGSTDISKVVSSFSSRGPCFDGRICPDIMAVGSSVTSSWPDGGMRVLSGTSMATPHVGGGAALITQATRALVARDLYPAGHPTVVKSELEDLLKTYAEDLGAAGPDNTYGWGYIRLDRILPDILQRSRALVSLTSSLDDTLLTRGQSATVTVDLTNVGGINADGSYIATLTGPTGTTTISSGDLDVAPFDSVRKTHVFAGDALPVGSYQVDVDYTYSWRDVVTGNPISDTVSTSHSFVVERAELKGAKTIPAQIALGTSFDVVVELRNDGNLPARGISYTETIPGSYVVVPRAPNGPFNSMWASPTPDSKVTKLDFSTTMVWTVGTLAPGESWTAKYTLIPEAQGTHVIAGRAPWSDDTLVMPALAVNAAQTVVLPAP